MRRVIYLRVSTDQQAARDETEEGFSLVDMETFNRVQELFASRAGREARESRPRHFLKGHPVCGVCGRRLSLQKSKGRYLYYFCLGQKDRRKPTGCR